MDYDAPEVGPARPSSPNFRMGDQPDGMAHATILDDSGEWSATKVAPAVVEQ